MTKINELMNMEKGQSVIQENASGQKFIVKKDLDGNYKRNMVYEDYASFKPETRKQQIELYNLLNDEDNDTLIEFNSAIGNEILLGDVIINTYDRINEKTGEEEYGAVTYIFTPDHKEVYVTSSKSVYSTIQDIFKMFGRPQYDEGQHPKIKLIKKKGRENNYNDIKIIG